VRAGVLRSPVTSDLIIVVIALIATAFAITLAVVVIEMWPWFRKRPGVPKESDDERLEVSVTFVPAKGYVASAPELRQPVVAVSLGGLRRRIEALMLPDNVNVRLILDRTAELERAAASRRSWRAERPRVPRRRALSVLSRARLGSSGCGGRRREAARATPTSAPRECPSTTVRTACRGCVRRP